MKPFSYWILDALHRRVMILLEFEPGDAVQTGYFDTLHDIRRDLATEGRQRQPARNMEPEPATAQREPAGGVHRLRGGMAAAGSGR